MWKNLFSSIKIVLLLLHMITRISLVLDLSIKKCWSIVRTAVFNCAYFGFDCAWLTLIIYKNCEGVLLIQNLKDQFVSMTARLIKGIEIKWNRLETLNKSLKYKIIYSINLRFFFFVNRDNCQTILISDAVASRI